MAKFRVKVEDQTYRVEAPDEATAWEWASASHGERKTRMEAATAADVAKNKAEFEKSEAARPWADRMIQNVGAGFDTVWQGAKQLVGQGPDDAELDEQRRMKQELADRTTGGGIGQIVGETLPTMVLPVGAAGGVARAVAYGAAGGAGAGALQPVKSDESRLMNMAIGGAGGAVLPGAVAGAQRALPRALGGRGGTDLATRGGERLVRALGGPGEASRVAGQLEAPRASTRVTRDVPLTAAEKTGRTELAALEGAARRDFPGDFADFTRRQNEGIYDATLRAGREGTETRLGRLDALREARTTPGREEVMTLAGRYPDVAAPLQAVADGLRKRSAAGSAARKLADMLQSNIDEAANPEQLYALRKELAKKLSGPMTPGDDVAAAVKGAQREARSIMAAIDDRLNEAATRKGQSSSKFSEYLDEYSGQSRRVDSARAQLDINTDLANAGRPRVGDAPEVTRTVLKQALAKHGTNKFGSKLSPEAQGRYGEVQELLGQMEEPMRSLKKGGTGGGGSQTSVWQSLGKYGADMLSSSTDLPVVKQLLGTTLQRMERSTQQEVAQMMMDPQRAAAGIRAALRAGEPLSDAEKAFLALARGGAIGGTAALTGQ